MNTDTGAAGATTTDNPTSTSATATPSTAAPQTAQPGAAATGLPASGTPAEGAATPPAAGAADAPWQDGLDGDLKTDPLFRTYKSVDDLAKAHKHLTALKGASAAELLKIPSKPQDADPDAWAPIHKALGVPDDPKDYKIELAAEAAADTPELANVLRELGGKARFQPAQMNAVIETLNELGQKAAKAEADQLNASTAATDGELRREWGAAYEANKRGIGKLMRDALGGQIDEAAAADLETSLGSNLTLSRVLAHAISKMAEPETPEGANAATEGARPLTPAAATSALNAFYADPEKVAALNTRGHPQHDAVVKERAALLAQQNAGKRPDQAR